MHSEPQHEPTRRLPGGPMLWLLPVLLFCASLTWFLDERADSALAPQPRDAQAGVPGWVGRLDGVEGLRLHARLTRLHASPERQSFDSKALARHFGLEPGEPWRLTLRLVDERAGGEAAAPLELRLRGLVVTDAQGARLRATTPRPQPVAPEIADPLAVLLAPPEVLHAGEEAQLVLWGPAPRGGARLGGVALARPDESGGLSVELELGPRVLAPGPDESVLASLEVFARSGAPAEEVDGAQRAAENEE